MKLWGVSINNDWCEEVDEVKKGVGDFFKSHFQAVTSKRPAMEFDFCYLKISAEQNQILTAAYPN